jgi:hypothetical protein
MLTNKAYLSLEDSDSEAVFELQIDLEDSTELSKQMLMGNRGQYLQEVYQQIFESSAPDLEGANRRKGFSIDAGAGEWAPNLSFGAGMESESIQWGDGSGDPQRDASGAEIHPMRRKHVLEQWLARTRTDSANPAYLYWGEWTDGRFEGDPGAFGEPMTVAVREATLNSPDPEQDTSTMTGSLTIVRIAVFPDKVQDIRSSVSSALDDAAEKLNGITDY